MKKILLTAILPMVSFICFSQKYEHNHFKGYRFQLIEGISQDTTTHIVFSSSSYPGEGKQTNKIAFYVDGVLNNVDLENTTIPYTPEQIEELKQKDAQRIFKLETVKQETPYGFAYVKNFSYASSDVRISVDWKNINGEPRIKYIKFTVQAFNKVGDRVRYYFPSDSETFTVASGESKVHHIGCETIYYREPVYNVTLKSCKVQTYDGKWHSIPINKNFEKILE